MKAYPCTASLEAVMQSNAELREQLEAAQTSQQAAGLNDIEDGSIPRPKGTFSIQVEMGLATSTNKCDIYKGTLVSVYLNTDSMGTYRLHP